MFKAFPSRVRIGPFNIIVKICDGVDNNESWGTYTPEDFTIRLDRSIPSHGKALEVVMHELNHAVWHAADIKEKIDEEERIVRAIGTWQAMVYRDNPTLLKWITYCSKKAWRENL